MLNILTSYSVRLRKAPGCSTDYSRLLGAAEKCCSAGRPSGEEGSIGAGGCKKEQKTAHSSRGVQNTGEDLHIRPANRERNPSGFQLPCLSSEDRSICRVSRTGIRNWGSEATTLRSAGSEQDSTRCPSRPRK